LFQKEAEGKSFPTSITKQSLVTRCIESKLPLDEKHGEAVLLIQELPDYLLDGILSKDI
jgi:hypothetical protein